MSFHSTSRSNALAQARTGTNVLEFTIVAGTSSVSFSPFTVIMLLSITSFTVLSLFVAVTVFVLPSYSTSAPIASNTALTGSIVLPSITVGLTSVLSSSPPTTILIGLSAKLFA